MPRPSELPDFTNPPIDEVVVGLQFDRIAGFTDAHAGLYWQRVRSDYPRTQSRPRGDNAIEKLSDSTPGGLVLPTFELVGPDSNLGNRTWLLSVDDTTLLQVQDTQFLRNWRRRGTEYPHLDENVEAFWVCYEEFESMLAEEGFGPPVIRQVELSYFNWVSASQPTFFKPTANATQTLKGLGPEPEQARCLVSYLDVGPEGVPRARLHVELQPGLRPVEDGAEGGYQLVLVYRAPVTSPSRQQLDEVIARGREVIDWSFVEMTTDAAQEEWGRVK